MKKFLAMLLIAGCGCCIAARSAAKTMIGTGWMAAWTPPET